VKLSGKEGANGPFEAVFFFAYGNPGYPGSAHVDAAVEHVFEGRVCRTAVPAENRPPTPLAKVGQTGAALSVKVTKSGAPHKTVIIHSLV
jgi:hypothetical protein